MINRVVLVGRLTKELDLRYTGNGTAVGSFTMAVNRQFTNQKGEREADFINCVIWRKSAENMAKYTKKGSMVGLEGRIQTRSYDDKDGKRVYVTEVVVDSFSLLDTKQANSGTSTGQQTNTQQQNQSSTTSNYGTNNNYQKQSDPFEKSSQPMDIDEDDLPF
ncbi:single-stranded DNA-binding protein [Carnobacterium mobile]|uniref:single-stranded DNA-binding protein n=1 Tax=Carnobacterium mobile TaxID=2750 RepID=UPI000555B287|nr:single-stranded DNA-binding protein [Carnobacterium mobile]